MKSMTGYGRGECVREGGKVTVELSSVNRKQGEISVALPRELEVLEAQIRDLINRSVSRGRLTARVAVHQAADRVAGRVQLNVPVAKAYLREFRRLGKELKVAGDVTLEMLTRAPGVFETGAEETVAEDYWPAVETALQQALAALVKMRVREGANLAKDLAARVAVMKKCATAVQKHAPRVQERYREQLRLRLLSAGVEAPAVADERMLKELVFFADRSDITEELTRLQSHFQQFQDCLKSPEPVGRTLDFLAQEMNREINTIGSKANDAEISQAVVTLKTELEKFREQAQNVE